MSFHDSYTITQLRPESFTPESIRESYREDGHFFDEDTMRFFGDRMSSYAVLGFDGKVFMYRRRGATVSVFGTKRKVGREFFGAWQVKVSEGGVITLETVRNEELQEIWDRLYG